MYIYIHNHPHQLSPKKRHRERADLQETPTQSLKVYDVIMAPCQPETATTSWHGTCSSKFRSFGSNKCPTKMKINLWVDWCPFFELARNVGQFDS